jgi:two-component system, OmpR family, sensor histidine kinase KdpD
VAELEPIAGAAGIGAPARGRYKIFLGMVAGVGKTYRMLQEGHAAVREGRDVVIGYLEPHDRPDTTLLAEGLEVVPRRRVTYRGTEVEDMDLPAVLARGSDLTLIDELAHTNAPGLEHAKRYEDIADVLDAGIDVFSTVNVQHLESLNDQVAELTGVRVRETVPDSVLGTADEVVLIDLTPEAVIDRLQSGKIYPRETVDSALNNFFKIENLAALREVALRHVAEDVETKRLVTETGLGAREGEVAADAAKAVGERLLALVRPHPSSQRLVRRAWRSAQRLGAQLDLLWVRTPGERDSAEAERQLTAMHHLASMLGAELLVEENDDVVAGAAEVVERRGSTYILIGESKPRRGLARLREPLAQRLMRGTPPGVDVRIVADRTERGEGAR